MEHDCVEQFDKQAKYKSTKSEAIFLKNAHTLENVFDK